ncbi:pentapeptide repeat-containing protein [Poseidonibacter lekithochrous]|uniref:pentapeptide repeat-containing protein n=1 Tax=Poseidonibacter lekithochrous TaxID=1904463 RepID=UPI000D342A61|nr:hypothetical protein [Poseidonibacter lekithochrous]
MKYICSVCKLEYEEEHFDKKQNKCLFHNEKEEWYELDNNGIKNWEKSRNKILIFWSMIRLLVDAPRDKDDINLFSFVFPFYDNSYIDIGLNKLKVSFISCKFLGSLNLNHCNFKKELMFSNCDFKDDVIFMNSLNSNIYVSRSIFEKSLNLHHCSFDNVTIEETYIESFILNYVHLNKILVMNSFVKNQLYLKSNIINEKISFRNSIFKNQVDLENSTFNGEKDFLGIDNSFANKDKFFIYRDDVIKKIKQNDSELKHIPKNRETARIIKDNFEQQNNVIEANKFYAFEMKEREKELEEDLKVGKNIFEYFIFKIHGLSSSHSQNAPLSLFWILLISFIYSYGFDFLPKEEEYMDILVKNYEQSWMYFVITSKDLFSFLKLIIWMSLPFTVTYFITNYSDKLLCFFIALFSMIFYMYLTKDFTLSIVSNNINPFSIITQEGKLGFAELIYRISIAYLIYQLIISIRQNTRRK